MPGLLLNKMRLAILIRPLARKREEALHWLVLLLATGIVPLSSNIVATGPKKVPIHDGQQL